MAVELAKILWTEGTFLGQQHFQQWDRTLEERERHFRLILTPLHWGIFQNEIDQDSLKNGLFRVTHFQGIFQNGQWTSLALAGLSELTINLSPFEGTDILIYVCAPKGHEALELKGYTITQSAENAAWTADYRQVRDEFDPSREREVVFGRSNLCLKVCKEDADEIDLGTYYALPIIKLISMGENQFIVDNHYIPPIVQIIASHPLLILLRQLEALFVSKIRLLIQQRDEISNGQGLFGVEYVQVIVLLQVLNNAIPQLSHLMNHSWMHPIRAYECLSNIIGSFCSLSQQANLKQVIQYNQKNLGPLFSDLEVLIKSLIEELTPQRKAQLILNRENELLYSTEAIEERVLEKCTFFLMVSSHDEGSHWITRFVREVKIAAKKDITAVMASALMGVSLIHSVRPPPQLSVKSGYQYFQLESKGEYWEKVNQDRNIAVFISGYFISADIKLVAIEV